MSKLYFSEVVIGTANRTVYGIGITSTEVEPKSLKSVIVCVSAKPGNYVEGWTERERRLEIVDSVLPLYTDTYRIIIPINYDIDVGESWKIAIRSGGTPTTVYVLYEYELR